MQTGVPADHHTQHTTTATTTAIKQTQPLGTDIKPTTATHTATTAPTTQHYASEPRANQVVQVLYPTAPDTHPAHTTTTTRTADSTATVPRKGLDLDVTASHVDSYTAPTPIHLTIHPDPNESTGAEAQNAATSANAIAYLHSVHPALPVSGGITSSSLQQPQATAPHARRNSEGAATSLNGQWTPLNTQLTGAPHHHTLHTQHADSVERVQRSVEDAVAGVPIAAAAMTRTTHQQQQQQQADIAHSSTVPPVAETLAPTATTVHGTHAHTHVPWGTQAGQSVYAPNTATHTTLNTTPVHTATSAAAVHELPTTHTERVLPMDATGAYGTGRTVLPLTAAAAAGPLVVGHTHQVGGVESIRQVEQVSSMSGERVAVTSVASAAAHHMPAAQTFTSTTAPQVLFVPGHTSTTNTTTTAHPPVQSSPSPPPVHGDQVYASEAAVIPSHPIAGSTVTTNPHDQQYYGNRAVVERDAAAAGVGMAAATVGGAVVRQQQQQVHHTQPLVETSGPSIVQVSDATNIQGGWRTPVLVDAVASGPLVVGERREVGSRESLKEVEDAASLLSRGERVAVPSAAAHHMPAAQTFSSTGAPQVIHTQTTYTSATAPLHSTAMATPYTRQLDDTTTSSASVVQVSDVSRLHHSGLHHTPVVVESVASGPRVVGERGEVGGGVSNVMHANEMRGERLPLATAGSAAATPSTHTTLHTMPLATVSQPAIQYINQPTATTHTTTPAISHHTTAHQHATTTTTAAAAATAVAATEQRTVVTHEPISAAEAAAHTTTKPLTTGAVTTGIDFEHRQEHIGAGPNQVLHVPVPELEGAGKEKLGAEAFSTKKEYDGAGVDSVSGGMKGMQLGDSEQQRYRKEDI